MVVDNAKNNHFKINYYELVISIENNLTCRLTFFINYAKFTKFFLCSNETDLKFAN